MSGLGQQFNNVIKKLLSLCLFCLQCVGILLYNPKVAAAAPVIMTLFQQEKLQHGSRMKPGFLPCTQKTSPAPTQPPDVGKGQLLGRGGKVHAKFDSLVTESEP